MGVVCDERVSAARQFARFYTKKTGVLNERLLESRFGLTEARVLYEIAQGDPISAKEISAELDLDAGYVSRVLRKFEKHNLISRSVSPADRRQQFIKLTSEGEKEFKILDRSSARMFGEMLQNLDDENQCQLLESMSRIRRLLDERNAVPVPYLVRPHRPGDMGWIVQMHGRIYTEEYDWDERFEGWVAEIVASFLKNYDAKSDCCWIAEMDGRNVGSAMVVRTDETTAKLRVVIVDPAARGLGIGERLVGECMRFARRARYRRMTLLTDGSLNNALRLYKKLGFELVHEAPSQDFGKDRVYQTWEMDL